MNKYFTRLSMIMAICFITDLANASNGSRLIAMAEIIGNSNPVFIVNDSVTYAYLNTSSGLYSQADGYDRSGGTPVPNTRVSYTYDASGHLTQKLELTWNTVTSAFDNSAKHNYTYNSAGYLINEVVQSWDAASAAWINITNNSYTLNAANYLTDFVSQEWNISSASWRNFDHTIYTLNSANQVTGVVTQTWDSASAAWANSGNYIYTLNAQGKVIQATTQAWAGSTHSWINQSREDTAYDASGTHVTQATRLVWNATASVWENTYRNIYTLNTSGVPMQQLLLTWNSTSARFDSTIRYTYAYDAAGNDTLETDEQWSAATNSYGNAAEVQQTFNSYNQLLMRTVLFWVSGAYVFNTNKSARYTYYYETYTPAGIINVPNAGALLSVYPVPAGNVLHISLKWETAQAISASMKDMQGRVYATFSAPAPKEWSTTLSVADMPACNYMLSIMGGNDNHVSRVITVGH